MLENVDMIVIYSIYRRMGETGETQPALNQPFQPRGFHRGC